MDRRRLLSTAAGIAGAAALASMGPRALSKPDGPHAPRQTCARSTPIPGPRRASARSARRSPGSIGEAITGLAFDNADGGKLYGVTAGVYLSARSASSCRSTRRPARARSSARSAPTRSRPRVHGARPALRLERDGDDLYQINKATGALTQVGESNLTLSYGDGLAFDRNGWLWAALDGDYGPLSRLDPSTGTVPKGVRLNGTPNSTGNPISSADFACDGLTLYVIVNDFGGASNPITIDTATGKITNKGSSVTGLDSIAWGGCPPPPQTTPGATLSPALSSAANLGTFIPGIAAGYMNSVAANVVSTAGDAALSVADAGPNAGRLVNGAFSLPYPLQARATTASPRTPLSAPSAPTRWC